MKGSYIILYKFEDLKNILFWSRQIYYYEKPHIAIDYESN